METTETKTVARINQVDILLIENGEKRVAIKPICEAIGVASNKQIERIKEDPILGSVGTLSVSTGSDGKEYKMFTIPFEFVFGWLFRIDSRNVKEESRESVLKYQVECYHVLYRHFTAYADFVTVKQELISKNLEEVAVAKLSYSTANKIMKDAEKRLKEASDLKFDDYDAENSQLRLFEETEE